jgi:hypothetical protein
MAGYSGTPLATKLGIKEETALAVLYAPSGFSLELPASVTPKRQPRGRADVVLAFFTQAARLEERIDVVSSMIFPAGGLWIAWPKRASGMETDLTDNVVRQLALPRGLVDNKVCAVDATWSALRVVWRVERRSRAPQTP